MNFKETVNTVLIEMAVQESDIIYLSELFNLPRSNENEFDNVNIHRVLTSKKFKKTTASRFAQKTHFKFKIYVDDVSLDPIKMYNNIKHTLTLQPDCISLFLGIRPDIWDEPLTPWMIGHRLGHQLDSTVSCANINRKTRRYLLGHRREIQQAYAAMPKLHYYDNDKMLSLEWVQLQDKEVNNDIQEKIDGSLYLPYFMAPLQPHNPSMWKGVSTEEVFYDIFAQYMKFGKVTFRCPDVDIGRTLAEVYEQTFNEFLQSLVGAGLIDTVDG